MSAGSLNHLRLTVRDPAACEAFYDPWLTLLGYAQARRDDGGRAWGRRDPVAGTQWLILTPAAPAHRHAPPHDLGAPGFHHVALNADSREQVDAVHAVLRAGGAEILDAPAEYDYEPGYYAVFFRDPNGFKLEIVHSPAGHTARMEERTLGRSGIKVSALGLGCWAIGGPFGRGGVSSGWGDVDDDASVAAIRRGLELGVTFFDTADVYGTGHSETILGRALGADRDRVAIATKFGNTFDEGTGRAHATDVSPGYVREACEASLRRLGTDRIDLYQCHVGDLERSVAEDVAGTLEQLCADGLIRAYGWSTDDVERAGWWAARERCASVQHHLNVLEDAPEMLALCEREGLASINRGPLAMGLLSGKFSAGSRLPRDDVRGSGAPWLTAFEPDGRPKQAFLDGLAAIRELLTSDGRSLVQGALGWIWARSGQTVPIPGFKSVAQAEENAGALAHGPLPAERMAEIDELLGRSRAQKSSAAGNPT